MFRAGASSRRKKREGEGEASGLSENTGCDVGCRAAVLLFVMLVLGWVSSQHVWEGTVLQDKKSCVLGHVFVVLPGQRQVEGKRMGTLCCPGSKGWGRNMKLVILPGETSSWCSALLFQTAVNSWKLCIWGHIFLPCQLTMCVTSSDLNHSACVTGL